MHKFEAEREDGALAFHQDDLDIWMQDEEEASLVTSVRTLRFVLSDILESVFRQLGQDAMLEEVGEVVDVFLCSALPRFRAGSAIMIEDPNCKSFCSKVAAHLIANLQGGKSIPFWREENQGIEAAELNEEEALIQEFFG